MAPQGNSLGHLLEVEEAFAVATVAQASAEAAVPPVASALPKAPSRDVGSPEVAFAAVAAVAVVAVAAKVPAVVVAVAELLLVIVAFLLMSDDRIRSRPKTNGLYFDDDTYRAHRQSQFPRHYP